MARDKTAVSTRRSVFGADQPPTYAIANTAGEKLYSGLQVYVKIRAKIEKKKKMAPGTFDFSVQKTKGSRRNAKSDKHTDTELTLDPKKRRNIERAQHLL